LDIQTPVTLSVATTAPGTNFTIALMGFAGVVVGAVVTFCGQLILHLVKSAAKRKLDKQRISLLTDMLEDVRFPEHWRKLSTLSRVIGASENTTKRLLIKLGARGSEKPDNLWGLLKHHPLNTTEQ
jgi:hypothetical protein